MILQAYIDDSGDPEVFTLGGYISTAERWIKFSGEWKGVLGIKRLDYFKMKEFNLRYAQNMEMELDTFLNVIDRNVMFEVSFSVIREDLDYICSLYGLSDSERNPYFIAWNSIVSATDKAVRRIGVYKGIEFIFDQQTEQSKVLLAWEGLIASAPAATRRFIKGPPIFRSDSEFVPLQAADLVAWWSRRFFRASDHDLRDGSLYHWRKLDRQPTAIRISIDRKGLRKQMRKSLYAARYPIRLLSDLRGAS
jgi:hypothetical protein